MLWATPAHAQATRTWVSGVGDDVNPCSRTAPCKTFAGAISKTAAGGEINCLDPAGYGTVTITKSIIIDCTGTFGSILNSGGINGVNINDSATASPRTIEVRLRGISINGAGTTPGLNGIRFLSGKSLIVEDVYIQNQKGGSGISIVPSAGNAEVHVQRVSLNDGGNGILVNPTGSGSARVSMRDVHALSNSGTGIRFDTTGLVGGFILGTADTVQLNGNNNGLEVIGASSSARVLLINSEASNNATTGVFASGAAAQVRIGNSTITFNATGVNAAASSTILSYGDNRNQMNTGTDGAFSVGSPIPKN